MGVDSWVSMKWITEGNSCHVQMAGYGAHGEEQVTKALVARTAGWKRCVLSLQGALGDKGMCFNPEPPGESKSVVPDGHHHDTIPPEGDWSHFTDKATEAQRDRK